MLLFAQVVPENAPLFEIETANLLEQWANTGYEYLINQGPGWAVKIVAALMIFIIGRIIARWVSGFILKALTQGKVDQTLGRFLSNIGYGILLMLVVIASLNALGINTTSVAAILAAAGLAIGLALQDSLSNFASGVMLILFRPFKVGDFVEAGGTSGTIEEIHIFHTQMRTSDNKTIIVPNSHITGGIITNYSTKSTRRIDLVIGCSYDDDLLAVKKMLIEILEAEERVLTDPGPEVRVSELGDSSVNFIVRGWANSSDYWATKCDLIETIKLGFDHHGFNLPYPQQDVHMHAVSG
ncbi:MAG: mechanosensitive ion channel protein MscS [Blastopirellula sp.]|nr:MAG: mechanosensitive ion channel protein MscS [Blastopirellula sp.]